MLPLTLTSCNSHKTSANRASRIKRETNYLKHESTDYYYSPDGKVVSIEKSNGRKINYQYLDNKILVQNDGSDSSGRPLGSTTLYLNSAGFADSSIYSACSYRNYYIYNLDGFVIQVQNYIDSNLTFTQYSTIKDGDIISETITNPYFHFHSTDNYAYYKDKENTIGNENTGMRFVGASSHNLVKREIKNGQEFDGFSYAYQFDKEERVILKTVRYANGSIKDSIAYTYY